jgi:hypothetical protein
LLPNANTPQQCPLVAGRSAVLFLIVLFLIVLFLIVLFLIVLVFAVLFFAVPA